MLLSQTAQYALRAMSCLALHPAQTLLPSGALARQARIPSAYLSKVMRRLVLAGLAESQRGYGGGFRLSKPPREIRFIDILEAVDYQSELGRCAFGVGDCDPDNPCPLHHSWSEMLERFEAWARQTSLSTIAQSDIPIPALTTSTSDV